MTHPTDPPMTPAADSQRWYESGPEPILADIDTAVLIVQVGLASNALHSQLHAAEDASQRKGSSAMRNRDIVSAFLTTAALTSEAMKLAQSGMGTLRPYVLKAGARPELLEQIGQLCAGNHPSAEILKRARDKLAFHWDTASIKPSVEDFGKNATIVWLESADLTEAGSSSTPVHALAFGVLGHALFPDAAAAGASAQEAAVSAIREGMGHVTGAVNLIVEFFAASLYGYMKANKIQSRTRSDVSSNNKAVADEPKSK
jgi:hypothetical protein